MKWWQYELIRFMAFAGFAGLVILLLCFQVNLLQKSSSLHVLFKRDDLPSQYLEESGLEYLEVYDASEYGGSYSG